MAKNRIRVFNFLNINSGPKTAWDKIYEWIVNRARLVMLVVEVLLVVTFITKVFVDIQASTYDIQIKDQKRRYDLVNKYQYPEVNKLQLKADNYSLAWNKASNFAEIINSIVGMFPNSGQELTIRLTATDLTITTKVALSNAQDVEAKLKALPSLDQVRVKIEGQANSQDQQILLTINANVLVSPRAQI